MRRLLFGLLLALPLLACAQAASYLDLPSAINKAGRQRMLTEFMVKEYLQILEGIEAPIARGHLGEAIAVFDDQIGDLKAFASTNELKQTVNAVAQNWEVLRGLLTTAPTRGDITAVRAAARRVLQAAERNTGALEAASGNPANRIIGLSGQQRMLSQRIAKNYLLLGLRFDEPEIREELSTARQQYAEALAQLRALPENNEEIKSELAEVQRVWDRLQDLLRKERGDRAMRTEVISSTDILLARMERATAAYQRLASH